MLINLDSRLPASSSAADGVRGVCEGDVEEFPIDTGV